MNTFRITRKELYEKLWTTPTTKLSKEFGISDVGLGKICRKYDIPKPTVGDWARVAHGHRLERTPLPPAPAGTGEIIEIELREQRPSTSWAERYPQISAEFPPIHSENIVLESIDSLSKLHPLLKESLTYLKSATPDAYSRLTPGQSTCIDINVSKPMLERTLKLLHTLFRFLEAQGFAIKVEKRYRMTTFVVVRDIEVEISIIEKVTRTPTSPSQTAGQDSYVDRKFAYQPSGVLSFRVMNVYIDGLRKEWNDTPAVRLEDEIVEIGQGILEAAVAIRIQDIERQEQNREYELRKITEKKKQDERQQEMALREKLLKDSADWQTSENLRNYIEALKSKREKTTDSDKDFDDWVKWATHVADELDPIHLRASR